MTFQKRRPDPPPPPPEPPRQLNCTMVDPEGERVPAGTPAYTDLQIDDPNLDLGIRYGGRVEEEGRFIIRFPPCAPKGQGANLKVAIQGGEWAGRIVTPTQPSSEMGSEGGDSLIQLVSTGGPDPFWRAGIVRAVGRCWSDDDGLFYPLGQTLFWAPHGWKFERDRIKQNMQFLAGWADYIRILGMVGWEGNEIDPTWPDYEQVMAELIDYAYDECGLRTQVTVSGGGPWDPVACARRFVTIIPGREHKFMHFEASNESYNNGPETPALQEIGEILRAAAPQHIVMLSAPPDGSPTTAESIITPDNANAFLLHLDRTYGDDGWRHVRQGYDMKDSPNDLPASSNEPIGPASSVASESDPLRLAMSRATSILCGGSAYVFHNGAGIYGVPNTPGTGVPRTANLWEMPDITNIMAVVKAVTKVMPPGEVPNWAVANDGWVPPNPVNPLHCTEQNEHVGPIKNYSALSGDGRWVVMPHGIRQRFSFQAMQACEYDVFDPLTAASMGKGTLAKGATASISFPDDTRQHALIFVGRDTPVQYSTDPAAVQARRREWKRISFGQPK